MNETVPRTLLPYKYDKVDEPSFLISDRSIKEQNISFKEVEVEAETPKGPKPPLVEAEEERIKQYQDKVLSAIT